MNNIPLDRTLPRTKTVQESCAEYLAGPSPTTKVGNKGQLTSSLLLVGKFDQDSLLIPTYLLNMMLPIKAYLNT